ncbi:MAG: class I SAM-dependent methyltransferase [Myxococcales bacterium]|nr:class I SAM-dependent methyltransferase [Myxococcales bacterium]
MTEVFEHNRRAWNRQSSDGESRWCQPVDAATIAAARKGDWTVILTPNLPAPRAWFGGLLGRDLLCLASGGGQQAPLLAAAGARVTSFDASEAQLAKDAEVAGREALALRTLHGDMADLSSFEDESFDLIFHPVSNVYVRDVRPVWRECHRVLRPGGRLLAGFMNPAFFLFDHQELEAGGPLQVRYALPYSDLHSLPPERLERQLREGVALEFSHSLDHQIGGQLESGFTIGGFYEDRWDEHATPLNRYMPTYIATLAIRAPR